MVLGRGGGWLRVMEFWAFSVFYSVITLSLVINSLKKYKGNIFTVYYRARQGISGVFRGCNYFRRFGRFRCLQAFMVLLVIRPNNNNNSNHFSNRS